MSDEGFEKFVPPNPPPVAGQLMQEVFENQQENVEALVEWAVRVIRAEVEELRRERDLR